MASRDERQYLPVAVAAARIDVAPATIRVRIDRGKLERYQAGRVFRVRCSELETLLREKVDPIRHPFNVEALADSTSSSGRGDVLRGGERKRQVDLARGRSPVLRVHVQAGGRDHQAQTVDNRGDLAGALRLSWVPKVTEGFFMRAESFFNFATYIDQVSTLQRYGGRRLHEHSMASRSWLCSPIASTAGSYVLDEPEAALSPCQRTLAMKTL
jgi:hypothetical protein